MDKILKSEIVNLRSGHKFLLKKKDILVENLFLFATFHNEGSSEISIKPKLSFENF